MADKITVEAALIEFVKTVEDTGGVALTPAGIYEPEGDRTWSDLGDAYMKACEALGRKPVVTDESTEDAEVCIDCGKPITDGSGTCADCCEKDLGPEAP